MGLVAFRIRNCSMQCVSHRLTFNATIDFNIIATQHGLTCRSCLQLLRELSMHPAKCDYRASVRSSDQTFRTARNVKAVGGSFMKPPMTFRFQFHFGAELFCWSFAGGCLRICTASPTEFYAWGKLPASVIKQALQIHGKLWPCVTFLIAVCPPVNDQSMCG